MDIYSYFYCRRLFIRCTSTINKEYTDKLIINLFASNTLSSLILGVGVRIRILWKKSRILVAWRNIPFFFVFFKALKIYFQESELK